MDFSYNIPVESRMLFAYYAFILLIFLCFWSIIGYVREQRETEDVIEVQLNHVLNRIDSLEKGGMISHENRKHHRKGR